jgi:hypothetical protein
LPLSPQQAKARHAEGQPYVAVLSAGADKRVIDIAGDWISVLFLDRNDRVYLQYDFKRVESGDLFLSKATHLEYKNGDNSPSIVVTFVFRMDGSILIEKRNIETGEIDEKESSGNFASNRESYPAFGDYISVSRPNRDA